MTGRFRDGLACGIAAEFLRRHNVFAVGNSVGKQPDRTQKNATENAAEETAAMSIAQPRRKRERHTARLQFRRRHSRAQSRRRPRREDRLHRPSRHIHLRRPRRTRRAFRPRAALAAHPPRGAHADVPARHHRLADRVSRRHQGRRRRGAGQHADDRGRLLLHAARQPRAAAGRLRRLAAEIRQGDPRVGRSRTRHRLRRKIARRSRASTTCWRKRAPRPKRRR